MSAVSPNQAPALQCVPLSEIHVRPTKPSASHRYNGKVSLAGAPTNGTVPAWTTFNDGDGGPPDTGWSKCTHCEGDTYYHHRELHLVTPTDPHCQQAEAWLLAAHACLSERAKNSQQEQNLQSAEIYFYLPEMGLVEYYLIDHSTRTVFWVEDVPTSPIKLQPYETPDQLKLSLLVEYWTHVDYFPMHQNVDSEAERELIAILSHGWIDDSTAPGSTSPYGSETSRNILEVLRRLREDDTLCTRGYRIASFARIWASYARVRLINRHGLSSPRLDRLQWLHHFTSSQLSRPNWCLAFGESILLPGQPRHLFKRMTALWNGRVVYERHWSVFFQDMRDNWNQTNQTSLGIWLATLILMGIRVVTYPILVASTFSAASLVVSLVLLATHSHHRLATAMNISAYVAAAESYHHGLRPLSLLYSVPQALMVYAALLLQTGLLLQALEN